MPSKPNLGKTRGPAATASAPALEPDAADRLDRYDLALLRELQADARLSNAELAARIGLSAAPTWRRVRRLEQQGYITGYRAEIDRRKVGLGVLAFVRVDAERNNADATRALEDAVRRLPEVVCILHTLTTPAWNPAASASCFSTSSPRKATSSCLLRPWSSKTIRR